MMHKILPLGKQVAHRRNTMYSLQERGFMGINILTLSTFQDFVQRSLVSHLVWTLYEVVFNVFVQFRQYSLPVGIFFCRSAVRFKTVALIYAKTLSRAYVVYFLSLLFLATPVLSLEVRAWDSHACWPKACSICCALPMSQITAAKLISVQQGHLLFTFSSKATTLKNNVANGAKA